MAIDAKDPTSRKWQLTFNNPVEQGWTHEAIKKDQTNCNHYRTHFRKKQGEIFCAKKGSRSPLGIIWKNAVPRYLTEHTGSCHRMQI